MTFINKKAIIFCQITRCYDGCFDVADGEKAEDWCELKECR